MLATTQRINGKMFPLIVFICFSVAASGQNLGDTQSRKYRTFSCSLVDKDPARFMCKRGDEAFFLASSDFEKKSSFEVQMPMESKIQRPHIPMIFPISERVEPKRSKRQFGGGFGASHSQSSSNSFGISNSFGTGFGTGYGTSFGSGFPGVGFPGVGGGFGGSFGASTSHSSSSSFGGSSGGFFG